MQPIAVMLVAARARHCDVASELTESGAGAAQWTRRGTRMKGIMQGSASPSTLLKALVFLMFAMFAMTTDSVGTVIPEIIREFSLGMTAAGSFQYASMAGVALSAISLGFLADRMGRKLAILLGLAIFGASTALFAVGHGFASFIGLLFMAGIGIGIFKAGALALIGDLTQSPREHASIMSLIEGFFGIGAIIGPALVVWFLHQGMGWKWVYLIAAALCGALFLGTAAARFPRPTTRNVEVQSTSGGGGRLMADPVAMTFAAALMLYVGAEAAIYVWVPTYFAGYTGINYQIAGFAVAVFFVLRAIGRFLGAWLLARLDWVMVLLCCSAAMAVLFLIAIAGGRGVAAIALPATGLFMSVLYPTINSTGISCYEKSRHGTIAGFLLFFTCISAVLSPLCMALIGDRLGDSWYCIALGALFSCGLAFQFLWFWLAKPFADRLHYASGRDSAAKAAKTS